MPGRVICLCGDEAMYDAIQDQPEIEYLSGRPYAKVSPKRVHAMVQAAALLILQRCAGSRGAVGPEWRFQLSAGTSLVPDVAFVSYERLRALSEEQSEEPPFAPDIAIEVRSPSHRSALAQDKIRRYLAHGAQVVLDVDPATREVHAWTAAGEHAYCSGDRFTSGAFPWLQFEIAELFAKIEIPR